MAGGLAPPTSPGLPGFAAASAHGPLVASRVAEARDLVASLTAGGPPPVVACGGVAGQGVAGESEKRSRG
eukprot:5962828-Amphidinium_carterae.1